MKKILFIIWSYSQGGGAEKILSNLVNNLSSTKYEIDILEIEHYGVKKEKTNDNINILKPLFDGKKNSILYRLYKYLRVLAPNLIRLKSTTKKYDYEVSFNYLYPTYLLNKKSKNISWFHGSIENLLSDKKNRERQLKHLKKVNNIVAISDATLNSIEKVYPQLEGKINKIYNGYDLKEIEVKSLENVEVEKEGLVFIGRLEEAKGVKELLDLYKSLFDLGVRNHLYFIGDGEERNSLYQKIKNYNLEEFVHLIGYVQNPYPYIKQASYIVSCSKSEGFPTIFVEGLALGVGFVSTKVGGTSELYNDGKCGFFGSLDEMHSYLLDELKKEKSNRKIQSDICKSFVSKFAIEYQIEKFEELLESVEERKII